MKAIFITLLFTLSIPLGGFSAEELHADLNVSANVNTESIGQTKDEGNISKLAGNFGVKWSTLFAQMVNFCIVAFFL